MENRNRHYNYNKALEKHFLLHSRNKHAISHTVIILSCYIIVTHTYINKFYTKHTPLSLKKSWIAFKLKNNEDLFLHRGTDQLTQSTRDQIFNSKFDNMKLMHLYNMFRLILITQHRF